MSDAHAPYMVRKVQWGKDTVDMGPGQRGQLVPAGYAVVGKTGDVLVSLGQGGKGQIEVFGSRSAAEARAKYFSQAGFRAYTPSFSEDSSQQKDQSAGKLITSGSDASAGFLVGPNRIKNALGRIKAELAEIEFVTGPQQTFMPTPHPQDVNIPGPGMKDYMSLEDMGKAIEPANIPSTVPDYRREVSGSKRVCRNCVFFDDNPDTDTGYCDAYNFLAIDFYTCDTFKPVSQKATVDSLPDKYQNIADKLKPTQGMIDAAQSALDRNQELRENGNASAQGMTPKGSQRASYLANLTTEDIISPEIWRDINSFINGRGYQTNRQSPNYDDREAAWVAWNGWGGDAARKPSENAVAAIERVDAGESYKGYDQEPAPVEIKNKDCWREKKKIIQDRLGRNGENWSHAHDKELRSDYDELCDEMGAVNVKELVAPDAMGGIDADRHDQIKAEMDETRSEDDWTLTDSIRLWKSYLDTDGRKSFTLDRLDPDVFMQFLESHVILCGGQIFRVELPNGQSVPYDDQIGVYTAKDLIDAVASYGGKNHRTKSFKASFLERMVEDNILRELPSDDRTKVSRDRGGYVEIQVFVPKRNAYYQNFDRLLDHNFDWEAGRPWEVIEDDGAVYRATVREATYTRSVRSVDELYLTEMAKDHTPSHTGGLGRVIKQFLPGDRVFVHTHALRSLADVLSSERVKTIEGPAWFYRVKLVNADGIEQGIATVAQDELSPRSMRAIKRVKAQANVNDLKGGVEEVAEKLKSILDSTDENDPEIDLADVEDVQSRVNAIIRTEEYQDAFSKNEFRKYVRGMQDILVTLAAISHLFTSADELSKKATNQDAPLIRQQAQRNAYQNILNAYERAKGVLMERTPMRYHRRS